jgi:alginate O-acetyltransferase complex protein AlgI
MLFNSQEFLFVFLPVTLLGFYLLGRVSRQSATLWLILTSLIFYGWWRPLNILIIGPSIIVNYLLASYLLRLSQRGDQPGLSRALLLAGILFNVAFLGFFKYADFVYGAINDAFGATSLIPIRRLANETKGVPSLNA